MPHPEGTILVAEEEAGQLHVKEVEGLLRLGHVELVREAEVVQRPHRRAEVEGHPVCALEVPPVERLTEADLHVARRRPEHVTWTETTRDL